MMQAQYGNWISITVMRMLYGATGIFLLITGVIYQWYGFNWVCILFLVAMIIALLFTLIMQYCRNVFSFNGGKLMVKIHDYLLEHLGWDGRGDLLDIGCGSGALTIRSAKKFSSANCTGIDYWGFGWSYSHNQCDKNAQAEGVQDRIAFQHGDAAHLDFPDESFDAVVSNFVFHEVRTEPDKRALILEALRVLKKGGYFSLQDLMSNKRLYGDMNEFVQILKEQGISEVHYIGDVEKESFIASHFKYFPILKGMGLLYGRK